MNRREKEKLVDLVASILEFTSVLHPTSTEDLINRIYESSDKDILDVLTSHMNHIRIYALYREFDSEASVRDIENLLQIIYQLKN